MRSNLYDPKDPHNIAIPGPRSLNEVYSAVLEAKDAELISLKAENEALKEALEGLVERYECDCHNNAESFPNPEGGFFGTFSKCEVCKAREALSQSKTEAS